MQSIEFSQRNGLYDIETFVCPVPEVVGGFFPVETVEQFPGRIAQPEEWFAVPGLQVAPVFTHLQLCFRLQKHG
jgi:hypothetical protein